MTGRVFADHPGEGGNDEHAADDRSQGQAQADKLAGPPLIGMTAELVGLRLALVTILCGVLAIAVFAGVVCDETAGGPASVD